jgi:anti-anti-sigma factor
MFDIKVQNGKEVLLSGRFDASQIEKAYKTLDTIKEDCIVDFKELQYISSAGLGALIKTYSRLKNSGHSIKLINMNKHIYEVFKISALDKVFLIDLP